MRRALLLLALISPAASHAAEIRVLAAASLSEAVEDAAREWERTSGHTVSLSFGASNLLARQIDAGAPGDLFLSADERTMDALAETGRIVRTSRTSVLSNTLAVVVPLEGGTVITRAADLARNEVASIALAEPHSVPAGIYARRYLENQGLWQAVAPKVIPVENARAALAAVEAGNAASAIVFRTDALSSERIRIAFDVARDEGPAISYPFALLRDARSPAEAAAFLHWLEGDAARAIFASHGFVVTGTAAPRSAPPSDRPLPSVLSLTLRTAALSTLLILVPGLAVAWLLARYRWRGKSLVETLVALPLVMPPVATGLILLFLLGRRGVVGRWLHSTFGLDVIFTWKAIVLAMMVMSFPLFVRAARVAFEEVDPRLEQIARTLGARDARVFLTITLPLAARGVVSGMLLAFARAVGEFGATILVAGNIPGRTSTLSLSIYNMVQLGRDDDAFRLMAVSVAIAFAAVWTAEAFLRRSAARP